MKKFLSLVLALVMTMSLVTISAGAKDFTDDDKITYEEAVNVISTIGVVGGYPDGSFDPQGALTRGAAAKIICNMILGPTTAAELRADTAPFKDVPTNHTFAGYIAYCAKEGIISGYADGTFRPAGTLTGYAFMKMLLGALGYDASREGYTGANWSINVAKQALAIGLNASLEGEFNGVKAVNREEACLYAFNTLQADLVEYETIVSATLNGQTINVGNSIAKAQTWQNSATRKNNIKADNYIQFAEQFFTKLELTEDIDVFGRPDREWEFDGKDIGTYVNYDLLVGEYTEEVTGLDLYTLLGKSTIEDYDTTVYIDGVDDVKVNKAVFTAADMNKNNKDGLGDTGDGVLTQVFVDNDSDVKEITVAIINTYLAIADSDYSEKKEEASFSIYGVAKKTVTGGFEFVKEDTDDEDVVKNIKASIDDFDVEGVEEDDAYLVNLADGEIQAMQKAEVVEDAEISSFKLGSNVTADGTKYKYADTAEYDVEVLDNYTTTANGTNLKDDTYNIYLDQYGFLIGVDLVDEADNYIFITGIDDDYSYLSNKNVDASGIFTDGTMETIRINTSKSDLDLPDGTVRSTVNAWYTYTVSNDGVYTVKRVADQIDKANKVKVAQKAEKDFDTTIDKKNISLPGTALSDNSYTKVYGNDNTVYLTASIDTIRIDNSHRSIIIDDVDSVTTGIKNANIEPWTEAEAKTETNTTSATDIQGVSSGVYTLYKDNGYIIAAVVVGEDAAASKNLVYVTSKNVEREAYDKTTDEWTWSRKVIYNGEEIELIEKGDSLTYIGNKSNREGEFTRYDWYQVQLNANGEVIGVKDPGVDCLNKQITDTNNDVTAAEYLTEITNIQASINEYDTVLFEDDYKGDKMEMKGSTLYVTTHSTEGFFVAEDAKIVLIQTNKNKETTEFYTGADELEDIVDTLNENKNGKYDYYVGAILEDGAATTVVIYDYTNNYDKPTVSPNTKIPSPTVGNFKVTVPVVDGNQDDVLDLAIEALEDAGYEVTKVASTTVGDNLEYELTASKNGIDRVFITETVVYYKLSYKNTTNWDFDGPTYVKEGEKITLTLENTSKSQNVTDGATRYVTLSGAATANKTETGKISSYKCTVDVTVSKVTNGEVTVSVSVS